MPIYPKPDRDRYGLGPEHVLSNAVKVVLLLGLGAALLVLGYVGASVLIQLKDLPGIINTVERYEPIEAIQLFDRYDHLICTVEGDEDRRVVPLSQISTQMQQAMLAAEDHHFFEHHGINMASILRAFVANLQAGHVVEGGSTITQQLVKNLFFTESGRTVDRKIKEALIAWELERRYTKERILEMYLNQIYFGNNAYGIERAAYRYFDKSAAELNLAQAAFLAGLVKAPSELGAPANRAAAITRQRDILAQMVEYGYITTDQKKIALNTKLVFKQGTNPLQKYPYYVSYVLSLLRERFTQAEMRKQGLRVYTNLDPKAQELAEETLAAGIEKAPKGITQGALVSVSVPTGAVYALVGGVGNFWQYQFNRATNPHTAGSSFKPFVYLTAFLKDAATPETMIDDKPLVIHQPWGLPDYAPKDFDHHYLGRIPVRKALALSRNIPSVRMAQSIGINNVVETARLAGITTKLDANLALALGCSAVTPLDMAAAYSTFARGGIAIKPQVLRRIESNRGQIIAVFESNEDKVFPPEPVAELVSVMQDVVRYGTGTQAKLADRPVAGKTGTADAGKDIWFIGFTPDLVTACWAGNDENLPVAGTNVTGGVVMAKIWRQYNEAYYKAFPTPPGSFATPTAKPIEAAQPGAEKTVNENNPAVPVVPLTPTPQTGDTSTFGGAGKLTEQKAVEDQNAPDTTEIKTMPPAGNQTNPAQNDAAPPLAPERAGQSHSDQSAPVPTRLVPSAPPTAPRLVPIRSMPTSSEYKPPKPTRLIPADPNTGEPLPQTDSSVAPSKARRLYPAPQQ